MKVRDNLANATEEAGEIRAVGTIFVRSSVADSPEVPGSGGTRLASCGKDPTWAITYCPESVIGRMRDDRDNQQFRTRADLHACVHSRLRLPSALERELLAAIDQLLSSRSN